MGEESFASYLICFDEMEWKVIYQLYRLMQRLGLFPFSKKNLPAVACSGSGIYESIGMD
jgi:hypothetical protein